MKRYAYDSDELEQLSNELLDKHHSDDPTDEMPTAEIALIGGKLTPQGFAEVGGVKKAEQLHAEGIARDAYLQDPKEFERRRAREQIITAFDNNDRAEAARLAGSDRELLRFALSYKRRPGKQKTRPNDYSDVEQALLDDLLNEVAILIDLWKRNDIKVIGPKRAAIRIAASRAGKYLGYAQLDKKLISWDKNLSTKDRRRLKDRRRSKDR